MNIVYFGNGIRGVRCLEALQGDQWSIGAVIGHNEASDVVKLADRSGIKTFWPEKVNDGAFLSEIASFSPDLFILSGYNQILHREILRIPKFGAVNLHGGKLPEFRGVAPINWQIIIGERIGGCCVLYVDEGIDTGDIIEQQYYRIEPDDSARDVIDKQLALFPDMLLRAVRHITAGTVQAVPQDWNEGAYYTRRYPRDGRLRFQHMTAETVHNIVRALRGPYPPAFCYLDGVPVRIAKTRLLAETVMGVPGRVSLRKGSSVIVQAMDRGLLVEKIVLENSKTADAALKLIPGQELE